MCGSTHGSGIYLVTFGLCLRALLFDRERGFALKSGRDVHWGMVAIALLMCIFCTFDGAYARVAAAC